MQSQQGSEPPRGKRRQPSPVKLKALLARSQVRLQFGRALALLRAPIWQSSRREAALPWASLAQTCLAFRLPLQEGAGCVRLGDATGAFLASAMLLPCLCTSLPSVLEEGSGAAGLHTDKGSISESSVRGKRRAKAGLLLRLLCRPDSAPHGEHQAPRAPGWSLQPRTTKGCLCGCPESV